MIRLRSPFVDCFSFVRGVRFPNIARDLGIVHTVRIFRGVDYLNTPQPLYFVQILQFVHVLHGLELVSGANFPDGFRFLHRSNRLECFGSLHSLRCFHCARSSRSPRSVHCHRSLHHPRSPPGVDCANFVPAAARFKLNRRKRYSASLPRRYCGHSGVVRRLVSVGELVCELLADLLDFRARVELAVRVVGVLFEVVLMVLLGLVERL